jgi:hypothetical protein
VFCAPCFLFSKARNSEFVSTPFCNWKNATGASRGALNRHSSSHTHQQCVELAAGFRGVVEKRADSIKSQLSEAYDKQVQANTAALLAIVDSILFLVKQGLGFRGSNWDKTSKREDGNFSHLLHVLWQVILKISDDLGIEPSRKRSVRRQQNRTNPPVTDTESYYRVAYYFAFLDHTLSHLKTRFPPELEGALLATFLLPGNIHNISKETTANIKAEYADHLPYQSSFESEVATWKVHVEEMSDQGTDLLSTC